MTASWLIIFVTIIYVIAAATWVMQRNYAQALILIGYCVANVGLLLTLPGGNP